MVEDGSRKTAAERRESILRAAGTVFGERGYYGATTDQIARAAGISQPYVVRLFGSKEALFLAVLENAKDALLDAFRSAITEQRTSGEPMAKALGDRYVDLARDRGIHLSLLQAFMQGSDPVIGAAARKGYLAIWRMVQAEAGLSVEEAGAFLAQGMLLSVVLALDMTSLDAEDPDAHELLVVACGPKLPLVLELAAG